MAPHLSIGILPREGPRDAAAFGVAALLPSGHFGGEQRLGRQAPVKALAGALLLEQNDEYAIQKRQMSLESLAAMSENPPIRLPAAPALA